MDHAPTPYDHVASQFDLLRPKSVPKELAYLEMVLNGVRPASSILDLGCGSGRPIAQYLAAKGHLVTGVDQSESQLALAKKYLPDAQWIRSDMERVEFPAGSFAAVICWDSLFHVPRQHHEAILRNIHRWLLEGGRLMVSSGGSENPPFTDTMFGHEFFYDSHSPEQMISLVERIGFRIVVAELVNKPTDGRDKGKLAIVAEKRGATSAG